MKHPPRTVLLTLPLPGHAKPLEGGVIWEEPCQNGHGGNNATGAPKITSTEDWAPRLDQGLGQQRRGHRRDMGGFTRNGMRK